MDGRVYNVTPYLPFHPGGKDMLLQGAGQDSTALFRKYHPWVNAHFMLAKCLVGTLADGEPGAREQTTDKDEDDDDDDDGIA
jgi:cytochrome b involved in lipid metabolism